MLHTGLYQTLSVNRISEHGLYLADNEGQEVLLPNRYVSLNDKVGDQIEVFIYHDTENRLTATRERPFATIGEVAWLEVVDKNIHGAFMNWGITAKDLFVPNSNQNYPMEIGRRYVVYLYRDNLTERVVATARLNKYISNSEITLRRGDQVDILVAQRIERGFRVVINNRNWGVLYDNQIFSPVHIGDRLTAYVSQVTDEHRIDLMLRQEGYDEVPASAERLEEIIRQAGGTLYLTDRSTPEEIKEQAQMSKKLFKRVVGYLLSHSRITANELCITLLENREHNSPDNSPRREESDSKEMRESSLRRRPTEHRDSHIEERRGKHRKLGMQQSRPAGRSSSTPYQNRPAKQLSKQANQSGRPSDNHSKPTRSEQTDLTERRTHTGQTHPAGHKERPSREMAYMKFVRTSDNKE